MLESVRTSLVCASGTYNVRANEVARHKALRCLRVQVVFLDGTKQVFELEKHAKGQALLDLVFTHLELIERDYFGLQYCDPKSIPEEKTQVCRPPILYFRVKFWVCDPSKLNDEYTRYSLFLQLRQDLVEGRLPAPPSTLALLASYALQSDLGDYNSEEHGSHYLSDLQVMPEENGDLISKIIELHKLHKGQSPADAEMNFLDHAKRLDLYGVDLHCAKSEAVTGNAVTNSSMLQIIRKRLCFKSENYDSVVGFNLGSYRACKCLWKSCVEHHTFFRLHAPKVTPKRMLQLGSKFQYCGKTEYQSLEESRQVTYPHRVFVRSPSRQLVRQLSMSLIDPCLSSPLHTDSRHSSPPVSDITQHTPSTLPKRPSQLDIATRSTPELTGRASKSRSTSATSVRQRADSLGYKVTSTSDAKAPKVAWEEPSKEVPSDTAKASKPHVEVPDSSLPVVPLALPEITTFSQTSIEADSSISVSQDMPSSEESAHGLITIRIKPDDAGKFGFNVKGGADQKLPVLVSRVVPGTPADCCYPRLNEGDQVLLINGRDVSPMSHEQVVNFIRASRECHSGELVLTVKQNVYMPEELDEPSFQYVPETLPPNITVSPKDPEAAPLHQSMLLLTEGLEAGTLVAQFEQLHRRKPDLTFTEARRQENEKKNRYRDISPYDFTRVVLSDCEEGDYINASHVNMEIAGSGIVNSYIACQGPLAGTCKDFWQMVWEQQSTLVVMLTTVIEQGRVKCHRYWPRLFEKTCFGNLEIVCTQEKETPGFAYREFNIKNKKVNCERSVTHMQYLAWPDHGVPDDSTDFLEFIVQVRKTRQNMNVPTVVHCSAGIGRTGVLILMETAQCLIEANEPVYPLDIVRTMRDQRAMMIQTASQYRFVCEAIQKVYTENLVQPLPEYKHR